MRENASTAVLVGVSLRTLRRGGDEKKTVQVFKNKSPQGIISAAFAHRSPDVIKPLQSFFRLEVPQLGEVFGLGKVEIKGRP